MNECNRRGRERFLHIVTCLENRNPYIMDYPQKSFPLTSALCAGHTQPLWESTQNTAGRILASFVKCLKFEFFGLRVLATWTESPLLGLLLNEGKLPNTQCRMLFRDCRQTVLFLYLSTSISAFLFFLQFYLLTGKNYTHLFEVFKDSLWNKIIF